MELPDTPLVQAAWEAVAPLLEPLWLDHSIRAFLLAQAWARHRAIEFDEEGLAVAMLFHDVGLARYGRNRKHAFQMVGSRRMAAFLDVWNVPRDRQQRLIDAIDYHVQPLPRWSKGTEVGLLQTATWMDVMGLRRSAIRSAADAIDLAFPRPGPLVVPFCLALLQSIGSIESLLGVVWPDPWR